MTASPTDNVFYVVGQRGRHKLVYDGHSFVRNKGNDMATYWRCSAMRTLRCPARIVTYADGSEMCLKRAQHTHDERDYGQSAAVRKRPDKFKGDTEAGGHSFDSHVYADDEHRMTQVLGLDVMP